MGILTNKFIITRNIDNEYIITIKQDGSTLPMVIDPTDSFTLSLIKLDSDEVIAVIDNLVATVNGEISIHDINNGQIKVIFNTALTSTLTKERGKKVDRYYNKPTYRLSIEANTLNNGKFTAKVVEVYID